MKMRYLTLLLVLGAASCSTPRVDPSADPEISRVASLARKATAEGQYDQAASIYQRALVRARAMDNSAEIANNAYNLAMCMIKLQKFDDARPLLSEARREFERLGQPIADILLLQAEMARAVGRFDEAVSLADQVIPSLKSGATPAYRLQVALIKTVSACDRGDAVTAKKEFAAVQKEAGSVEDPFLRAQAANASGRILLLDKDPGKAAAEFDREADLARKAGKYHDMALALGRGGQAYLDAGVLLPASDRFYRSARSLYAQQDLPGALKMIQPALDAAKAANDDESLRRIITLFKDIKEDVERAAPPPEDLQPVAPAEPADAPAEQPAAGPIP